MTTYPIAASENLIRAVEFATKAHDGQVHKYTGEPYIQHPLNVANLLINAGFDMSALPLPDGAMLCAAILHDTIEDCGVTRHQIDVNFGPVVASWVDDLTDQYTHEAYPDLNRFARKTAEAARASNHEYCVQTIKYADLIDNTLDIADHDPDFARVCLPEAEHLANVMDKGSPRLRALLFQNIRNARSKLGLN